MNTKKMIWSDFVIKVWQGKNNKTKTNTFIVQTRIKFWIVLGHFWNKNNLSKTTIFFKKMQFKV